ncbi:hypothetical protein GCM10018780_45800 [Streptomyces lanatus]|nr:hypothetical protein GCM10018780_45800 [Streptomyces lanatus]
MGVVEHLDHTGFGEVSLEEFAAGDGVRVQLGDPAVALGVVVEGVEDRLAGESLFAEVGDEVGEGFGTPTGQSLTARVQGGGSGVPDGWISRPGRAR